MAGVGSAFSYLVSSRQIGGRGVAGQVTCGTNWI